MKTRLKTLKNKVLCIGTTSDINKTKRHEALLVVDDMDNAVSLMEFKNGKLEETLSKSEGKVDLSNFRCIKTVGGEVLNYSKSSSLEKNGYICLDDNYGDSHYLSFQNFKIGGMVTSGSIIERIINKDEDFFPKEVGTMDYGYFSFLEADKANNRLRWVSKTDGSIWFTEGMSVAIWNWIINENDIDEMYEIEEITY